MRKIYMDNQMNSRMNDKSIGHTVKISHTNQILQKYRNSTLTYNLIRKIVHDMYENTRTPIKMENNDIMIYE